MDNKKVIVLKGRQLGISTVVAAYIVWYMLFHPEKMVVIFAIKQEVSKNLLRKCRRMTKDLPAWIASLASVSPTNDNVLQFELTNGSIAKALPTSPDAARSEAVSLLVVDEAAHVEKLEDIWTAMGPAFDSTGGRCIALSTPNGTGNWFHATYIGAEEGRNVSDEQ